jgi:hypothetical protein
MRIISKTVKIIVLTVEELSALQRMVVEAQSKGQSEEHQIGPSQFMSIKVNDKLPIHAGR